MRFCTSSSPEVPGGELVSKILSDNAIEIGRTFAAIHSPNEFDVKTVEGKVLIIRRETGKAVKLSEMSTGQRAAYALSLFLAMTACLKGGPRVLLFDDPIAHVDDINALSFLDHLREIAIEGSRQIFFATADNKLAALFKQKFRFLGSENFREIEPRRV
jgi:ABC-type lipoprotein export system ATPase subunit